jgi:CSLREA domain-containing protein
MKIKKSTFTVVLLLFCSLLAGAIAVEAEATFTVDSTNDAVDANPGDGICATTEGECTLRAAIQETNALPGADIINLPAGTYLLTLPGTLEDSGLSGDLDILDTLQIIGEQDSEGQPASIVDANQLDRVFQVYSSVTVSMEAIQIQGGQPPEDDNWVTFEDCGGGIYNSGHLTLNGVVITNNAAPGYGGGIQSDSGLQIMGSLVSNNDAIHGGGISTNGTMFMTDSQVLSNTATTWGGGIYQAGLGSMEIIASEISMNETSFQSASYLVGGGGIFSFGAMTLTGVNIVGNGTYGDGGGIYYDNPAESLEVYVSTFAENTANGSGGGIYNSSDILLQSSTLNANTAAFGGGLFNNGNATVKDTSIELNNASEGAGIYNSSLNESQENAGSLNLTGSILRFNAAEVNGGGIYNKANAWISDVELRGNAAQDGAGFFHDGSLYLLETFRPTVSIASSLFIENLASGAGAGLHNYIGILTIENSQFVGNAATDGGGAASILSNTIFTSCEFTDNQVVNSGGGLFIYLGDVELQDSVLSVNYAATGAGVNNQFGDLLVQTSRFDNNNAYESGGGFFNNGQASIERTTFYGNRASSKGGAVYNAKYVSGPNTVAAASHGSISEEMLSSISLLEYNHVTLDTCIFGVSQAGESGHTIYNADLIDLRSSTIENSNADQSVITTDGDTYMIHTIIASSSPHSACDGTGTYGGIYNLETGDGCDFAQEYNLINTDPLLVILMEPPFLGLQPRSPAIDAGNNSYCGALDYSGTPRPIDGTGDGQAICDIGAYEAPEPELVFADVPLNHWAYDYIISLYEDGYIAGCATNPERLFCPHNSMNRAESSVFVVRGIHPDQPGYLPATPTTQYFDDVPIGADEEWFSKWVGELYEQGFTSGCSEDPPLYCFERNHIRAEATVFYLRMLNGSDFEPAESGDPIYNDVGSEKWYNRWVNAAHEAGLIQPCQTDTENMLFRPEDDLSRAEAACMMYQAISKQVMGSVLLEDGICCVAGTAGETIDIDASFEATSPMREVTEMRILSGSREFTPAEMEAASWEPFSSQKAFSITIPLNWSSFYVYVQYRDSNGNLSPITSDDISVEGQPIEPPPTPTPIPTLD